MSIVKTSKVKHDDDTVRRVELSTGAVLTIAKDCDSPARLYCMDCDEYVPVIVEVVLTSQEEWEYAEGATPMCGECWSEDLHNNEEDADREAAARAADAYNEYREEYRREVLRWGE